MKKRKHARRDAARRGYLAAIRHYLRVLRDYQRRYMALCPNDVAEILRADLADLTEVPLVHKG